MNTNDQDDQKMLSTLREAVAEALERKRRLGQYAVVWRDNAPTFIGKAQPSPVEVEKPATPTQPTGQRFTR